MRKCRPAYYFALFRLLPINPYHYMYRRISNVRETKLQTLNVSRLVLQLSLPNPLKSGIKFNYIWVINNFIA